MYVVAATVGLDQQRIFGKMRQQAQLDLRVVGGQQHVAGFSDERGANFAAEFGADGNVLQVGIVRREPAGGRAGLIEGGMQTAGRRIQRARARHPHKST